LGALQALTERVKLLPGIEITLDEGHDVLILGAQDAEYERMSRASDVLAKAAADGFLTVLAHPFRWGEELAAYCALIDAIEARSCNHGAGEHYRMAQDYAEKYNLQQIYASDAHGLNFMNKFWLETEAQFETPEEFRNLILTGRYENRTRPFDMPLPPPYKAASIDELPDDEVCEFSTEHS
jgi:predicted metal-dependent phosphoesterase TrpH